LSAYGLVYTVYDPYLSVIYIPFPYPYKARTTALSIRDAAFIVIVYFARPVSISVEDAVVKVAVERYYGPVNTANSGLFPVSVLLRTADILFCCT
jgi:hypothetical protein